MNLFVYGTLAPGEPNERFLKNVEGTWKKGTVKGHYFNSGWGAALGYPGVILDTNGNEVEGQLFSSNELERLWSILDDFEGEGYQRVLTTVTLESSEVTEAFIYELSEAGRPVAG